MLEHFYCFNSDKSVTPNLSMSSQLQNQRQLWDTHQHLLTIAPPGLAAPSNITTQKNEFEFLMNAQRFSMESSICTSILDVNNNRNTMEQLSFQNNNNSNTNNIPNDNNFRQVSIGGYLQSLGSNTTAQNSLLGRMPVISNENRGAAAPTPTNSVCQYAYANGSTTCYNRNRYMPYSHNRACANASAAANAASCTTNPYLSNNNSIFTRTFPSNAANSVSNYNYHTAQPLASFYANNQNSTTATVNVASNYERSAHVQSTDFIYTRPSSSVANTVTLYNQGGTTSGLTQAADQNSFSSAVSIRSSTPHPITQGNSTSSETNLNVTLQITNLDYSMDEIKLGNFLLNQLKLITPVISLTLEGSSFAKVTVPDINFAKQVVSHFHRKKIGHKRMLVSYTRDSSQTEINTLRCQVAGLLKDVPYYTLPMYKFRELFQSRFKTSINVLDLYKMPDICKINADNNDEKFIILQPELVSSLESSPLMEGLQYSVPYCTIHFKREQHKGWAEQEIEPLPNVYMTISDIQQIIYPLLKLHAGEIPVASLVHCIEGELNIQITPNDNGVNIEHLVCCVHGIQIQVNNFGIKILNWLELNDKETKNLLPVNNGNTAERNLYGKGSNSDPLYQISREVIELVKMSPKSTMKFNRFIPAYHNHFGKQCRVADYGYTKLIELFEALSSVVQIMGDGENRQITLTHRIQIRRFTSDLLRVLRSHGNKPVLLSQLPNTFAQTQNRVFDITDYGVCDIVDILDGLVNSNIVVVNKVQNGTDMLISIPKRKQTNTEIEKTCTFAGEMVELFRNAPQYSILFQKFVRSYHYHFAYQCRLSDYGFLKLADLMEAIQGVVEMEFTTDEDKKIFLSPKVARRVFAEQCEELIQNYTGSTKTQILLDEVLKLHKKKYGYQVKPQTLGVKKILDAIDLLPYVEVFKKKDSTWIICHSDDTSFRILCLRACKFILLKSDKKKLTLNNFLLQFNVKYNENLTENIVLAMKHGIEVFKENEVKYVRLSNFMQFLFSVVRLLEEHTVMLLQDIKSALDCNIATTFEFGYPNLTTMLMAYPDVFSVNTGSSQERSEVSLVKNCELQQIYSPNQPQCINKATYLKQKTLLSSRIPLGEHNPHYSHTNGPPAKTRAIAVELPPPQEQQQQQQEFSTILKNGFPQSNNNTNNKNILPQATESRNISVTQSNAQQHIKANNSLLYSSSNTENFPKLNASFNTSNISNKENILNSSSNIFNVSPNSSNISVNDFNTSGIETASLWDRRHIQMYPVQTIHNKNMLPNFPPSFLATSQQNVITQDLKSQLPPINNCRQPAIGLYDNMQICPVLFEPPKPDTPPSNNMPFWINPIWTDNKIEQPQKCNSLNIKLPDMKALNVLPMLMSPYTLSKAENMKQVFNFESHDRKIA